MMPTHNHEDTMNVLVEVLEHRCYQEIRYGDQNDHVEFGTGPETRWLLPFTPLSADEVEKELRREYEDYVADVGLPTWAHLLREEVAEAMKERPGPKLRAELIQVASLAVAMIERLPKEGVDE